MVTYVFTPWREPAELLQVRRQFFPHQTSAERDGADRAYDGDQDDLEKHRAIARVSMWMQRGGCPHLVESTALLTAAMLSDRQTTAAVAIPGPTASASSYAVRAAFVTGLLDSSQDKQHKMSMYAVAKSVGLPATFVELRHQATHEQLPSRTRLRVAAQKALHWIWEYYWRRLPDPADAKWSTMRDTAMVGHDACRDLVTRCLDETSEARRRDILADMARYGETTVLRVLDSIADKVTDAKVLRRVVALTREVLGQAHPDEMHAGQVDGSGRPEKDLESIWADLARSRQDLREMDKVPLVNRGEAQAEQSGRPSWRVHENWVPKPIGLV